MVQGFNYDREVGLAAVDRSGLLCVTIKAQGLGAGTRVTLVWLPTGGSSWKRQARLRRRAFVRRPRFRVVSACPLAT